MCIFCPNFLISDADSLEAAVSLFLIADADSIEPFAENALNICLRNSVKKTYK